MEALRMVLAGWEVVEQPVVDGLSPLLSAEYVRTVLRLLLLPHLFGVATFYVYGFWEWRHERALEQNPATAWDELKHPHATPVQVEGVDAAYARVVPQVLFIDFIVAPFLAFCWGWVALALPSWAFPWDGLASGDWGSVGMSVGELLGRVVVTMVFYELALTLTHVLMHTEALYAWTHQLHHRGPQISMAGSYISAAEAAINGPGLSFLTAAVSGLPLPFVFLAAILGRLNLAQVHAGWRQLDREGPPEAAFHGVHHMRGREKNTNYGFAQWLDKALGTYKDPKKVFQESFKAT